LAETIFFFFLFFCIVSKNKSYDGLSSDINVVHLSIDETNQNKNVFFVLEFLENFSFFGFMMFVCFC